MRFEEGMIISPAMETYGDSTPTSCGHAQELLILNVNPERQRLRVRIVKVPDGHSHTWLNDTFEIAMNVYRNSAFLRWDSQYPRPTGTAYAAHSAFSTLYIASARRRVVRL